MDLTAALWFYNFAALMKPDPESLAHTIQDFLAASREAVIIEDGDLLYDMASARFSLFTGHGKCVLHLWSEERNTVRRVLDAEVKGTALRLWVMRFGQSKPLKLEICRERDRRSSAERSSARARYETLLQRVLTRTFPGWKSERPKSSMDLSRSFGPGYARTSTTRGQTTFAVLGVNAQETQASIDASLTFGILWLDLLRHLRREHVAGLKLFVPAEASAVVRARMACLHQDAVKWQLYEIDARDGTAEEIDCSDRGNIATRLVRCPDEQSARERLSSSIARVIGNIQEAEVVVLSSAEVAFRLHGLEFARARLAADAGFRNAEQIVFGLGGSETVLDDGNAGEFAHLLQRVRRARHPLGRRHDPLWRASPERWLESLIVKDVAQVDERLDAGCVYSQVPAFAASDRAMIDVLCASGEGRLAVLELKADEDIHLPLQGLDYWARVAWHHARGEFKTFGYFPGRELSADPPLLKLVAPALHVHPATDKLLGYLSPEIDCELVAVDERWREGVRVIFRKRRERF
jgi:hypothetical protein